MVLAKKSEMRKNLLTGSTAGSLETSCLHLLIHCPHSISGTSDAAIVQVSCCWKRTCCLREMVSIISICWSVDRSNVKVVWLVIQSSKTLLGDTHSGTKIDTISWKLSYTRVLCTSLRIGKGLAGGR